MGRRREQRLVIDLPVKVSGFDANNNPFTQECRTVDISRYGCRLSWLACVRGPGDTVEVRYGKERARFRVCWVGEKGTPREGHIGLRVLENKYIWGIALASPKKDDYRLPELGAPGAVAEPSTPISVEAGWSGQERRRHPRYRCPGEVELADLQTQATVRGRLGDISLGGCYVDMMAPHPVGTRLRLRLHTSEGKIETKGVVRASHPQMGMGLQFTEMTPENRQHLEVLVGKLSRRFAEEVSAPAEPDRYELSASAVAEGAQPATPPPHPTESADSQLLVETLLELLYAKGILQRDEFERALEKAKTTPRP